MTEKMKKDVKKGLEVQLRRDGRIVPGGRELVMAVDEPEFWDDLSGEALDTREVRKARKEELEEFRKQGVYTKVPIKECWDVTGKKPIGVRWVDINKGDKVHPDYRSRSVAKEIKISKREDLFAATPPLEAKKALFSMAVTEGIGHTRGRKEEGMKIDFVDVRRAYFHAAARRDLYVELPEEDREEGMCGKLNKAMYGTRDAAQNWEYEYVEFLEGIGFKRGAAKQKARGAEIASGSRTVRP
jgi:hypothetical protein